MKVATDGDKLSKYLQAARRCASCHRAASPFEERAFTALMDGFIAATNALRKARV